MEILGQNPGLDSPNKLGSATTFSKSVKETSNSEKKGKKSIQCAYTGKRSSGNHVQWPAMPVL